DPSQWPYGQWWPFSVESEAPAPTGQPRILLVEDDRSAALGFLWLLEEAGIQTWWAPNGPAALEALERFDPDVILLDLALPGMHGHEVAAELFRRNYRGQVVVITGFDSPEDRLRSYELGVHHHL